MEGFDPPAVLGPISGLISTWGVKVVGALAVLIIGRFIAGAVRRWVRGMLERSKIDTMLIPFVSSLAYYGLMAFVVIAVLGLFGVPTASFIAVLGAAGLAVGLALQGTLSNFAAGVMLLVFRPFKVGDYIEAAGVDGSVREINVFSTSLDTLDNTRSVLPNASVWGQTIKSYTTNERRRNDMSIGISYGDDIERAKSIIRDLLAADPRVLKDEEPLIVVEGLGESSVDLLGGPWCDPADCWDLRLDMIQKIKEGLERGGCSIPFPQRDLHGQGAVPVKNSSAA